MALATAQDYIIQALRKCGQVRAGYVPPAELLADGLNEWGSLFDTWAADRTMGFSIPQYTYPVTGTGSVSGGNGYTIGPSGADWTGPRPVAIVRANCKIAGAIPVYIPLTPLTPEEWADLSIRQMTGISITGAYYYDPQYPNGVFNVFPPLIAGNSIELFTQQFLTVPATLGTSYAAPPAYRDAVIYSLAERLWPMCSKQMGIHPVSIQWLAGAAYEACQKIRTLNRAVYRLSTDFPSGGSGAGCFDENLTLTGNP